MTLRSRSPKLCEGVASLKKNPKMTTNKIVEAEEDIPSIEETVLARKRADAVNDAKMVI